MFCPKCGDEFSWDVMVCPTCDVDTVDRLPGPEPSPDIELVSVLSASDSGVIAIAKSLLEGEKIDYFVRGDRVQDLFGVGRIGGFSLVTGPAEFLVRTDDADRARELLEVLTVPDPERDSPDDG